MASVADAHLPSEGVGLAGEPLSTPRAPTEMVSAHSEPELAGRVTGAAGGGGGPPCLSAASEHGCLSPPSRRPRQKTEWQSHEVRPVLEEPPPSRLTCPHTPAHTARELGGHSWVTKTATISPVPCLPSKTHMRVCVGGDSVEWTLPSFYLFLNQEGRVSRVICWLRASAPTPGNRQAPPP